MEQYTAALAGNPNVGKSTVFNTLTGMRQHTGNWPGKTVAVAEGAYTWQGAAFRLIDLPGTYSLRADSPEEQIARDFICGGGADVTVLVADATCLRRNLHLAVQLRCRTPRLVVCVNLMDEARRKGVIVIPIMFGRASDREQMKDNFSYMYGQFISCDPIDITDEFTKLFTKLIQTA